MVRSLKLRMKCGGWVSKGPNSRAETCSTLPPGYNECGYNKLLQTQCLKMTGISCLPTSCSGSKQPKVVITFPESRYQGHWAHRGNWVLVLYFFLQLMVTLGMRSLWKGTLSAAQHQLDCQLSLCLRLTHKLAHHSMWGQLSLQNFLHFTILDSLCL